MRGKNMCLSFGPEIIYEDAEFFVGDRDKVGVVGVNGAGKTTLFKVLLEQLELDSGAVSKGSARVGYLPQEIVIENEEQTVWDYLRDGRPIRALERELEEIYVRLESAEGEEQERLLKRMGKVQELLEYHEVYDAEDILFDLITDMDIDLDLLERPMSQLSGGQKSKMAFCQLLFSKAEILLLDEPTNHLDVSTKDYITNYLKKYNGTVMIISHDVEFLNKVVNKIMLVNKITHKIQLYEGDYTVYQKKYAEEMRVREMTIVQQEKEIKTLEDFVQRAKQASQTNHALKRMGQERAQRLEKKRSEMLTRLKRYKRVKMDIRPKREGGKIPLEVEGLTFAYPNGKALYKELSFKINGGERFLVVGENGVGKSTLLKLIMGILTPDSGKMRFNEKTDIAYYAQELEYLDPEKTILENVDMEMYSEWQLRGALSNFLFYEEDVNKRVKVLSPGEKARVALCKVLLQKANLLILDEPTNHLDPETQKIIGENFALFEGTIIVVSHNPSFVEQIGISRMLILPFGRIEEYSHELLEYYYELNTPDEEKY
ncbi:MAG: ABC-F type ribosomal protection protein [Clostridia bacterium]|nr:ABC-F type ribosomal protection protein [Clostridia bacterium]